MGTNTNFTNRLKTLLWYRHTLHVLDFTSQDGVIAVGRLVSATHLKNENGHPTTSFDNSLVEVVAL